jgi:hypothetical protein
LNRKESQFALRTFPSTIVRKVLNVGGPHGYRPANRLQVSLRHGARVECASRGNENRAPAGLMGRIGNLLSTIFA